ncbi:MAG: DUF262 domain-containing protein [Candidatus Eremiobacteraeota bacterium]|nr:DUF262 domain-containing protein [Candidatus Eremiobacteraeota bacterium]MCW5866423.1 DUF262 domain-containing protein [Candidatus Eremiobacteraeota bacterium]
MKRGHETAIVETSTANWGELVGNGKRLIVPPFQRDYAWERDNWEDLWTDLGELRKPAAFSHSWVRWSCNPRMTAPSCWLMDNSA